MQARFGDAVDRVPRDGEADRGKVDADLVRPARLETNPEERVVLVEALDLEVRDGVARSAGVERVAHRVVAVAADRRLDSPATRARPSADEREVLALERAVRDERLRRS